MSNGSQETVSLTLPDTQMPGCPEPSMPAPPRCPFQRLETIAEKLNEAKKTRGLETFLDPWDGRRDASSWGSWSITGRRSFWELSGEEKGHQCKEKCRDEPKRKNEPKMLSPSEVMLERQSLEGCLGWKCPPSHCGWTESGFYLVIRGL